MLRDETCEYAPHWTSNRHDRLTLSDLNPTTEQVDDIKIWIYGATSQTGNGSDPAAAPEVDKK